MLRNVKSFFRYAIIPGIVFQAVLSGGGYVSGREIVEYALNYGTGSILFCFFCTVVFALLLFLSIELARQTSSYNYRQWSKHLLGPFWPLFDLAYIALSIIAIAVVTSAATVILSKVTSWPIGICSLLLFLFCALILRFQSKVIIAYSSIGTIVLYIALIGASTVVLLNYHEKVFSFVSTVPPISGWLFSSLKYVGYNIVVIPACLYSFREISSRRQAAIAAVVASAIAIIPIILAISIMCIDYPVILQEPVPMYAIFSQRFGSLMTGVYYLAMLLTLIDTAVGLIHAIIDRLDDQLTSKGRNILTPTARSIISFAIISISYAFSFIGIIELVANYYGAMSYVFMAVCMVPLLWYGIVLLSKKGIDNSSN